MKKVQSLTSRGLGTRLACLALFSLAVAGCSADDIEFNGKIFDAMGLNNATKSAEPKVAARAPLVMPPNLDRVPEPGTPPEALHNDIAALNDPDKADTVSRAELERQQAEYCKVHYHQAKARGDNDADLAKGPLGLCRGSVLTAIKNWNNDGEEE